MMVLIVGVMLAVMVPSFLYLQHTQRATALMKDRLMEVELEGWTGLGSIQKTIHDTVTQLGGVARILELHLAGSAADRYTTSTRLMTTGQPEQAARGINFFMKVEDSILARLFTEGAAAIENEIQANGNDVDRECLHYCLHMQAGSSDRTFQEGLKRDCATDGSLLPSRQTASGGGMTLDDFCQHPHATKAGLTKAHVLALRLYTMAVFRSLNDPMRDNTRTGSHPLPLTMNCIAEAIRRLRAVSASQADANESVELWRGLRDVTVPQSFLRNGGTELAPLSTTTDLAVAIKYSASASSVLLKLETSSFMQRGADLAFLSAFPAESEILFPPLTFLEPKSGDDGKPQQIEVVDETEGGTRLAVTFHVITVVPHFGT